MNIKLFNALYFISLLCIMNLPKYSYLHRLWIYSVATALLFYYCCRGLVRNLNPGGYMKYICPFFFLSCVIYKFRGVGGSKSPSYPFLLTWPLYWRLKATASNVSCFRRLGYTLPGKCRPSMSFNDDASQLKWSDIRQHWFYDDLSLGGYRSSSVIPVITNLFTTDT